MAAFVSNKIETINHILCPEDITREAVLEFEEQIPKWMTPDTHTHVLDFRKVRKIHPKFYTAIIKLKGHDDGRYASDNGKSKVLTVNASDEITKVIARSGMDKAIGLTKLSLSKKIPADRITPSSSDLRTWLIRYLIHAGRQAMNTMFNSTLAADENYQQTPNSLNLENIYRVAIVSINSDILKANFRLLFDKDCLRNLIRASIDESSANDPELIDSTALEMLNLIYGGAKSHLNEDKNLNLPPAIPTLAPVNSLQNMKIDKKNSLLIPFATALGTFYLQIEFLT